MDPLTQGTVGANFANLKSDSKNLKWATLVGFLAGLAPDLDSLIRSNEDTLLYLEYHRQFSHSLIFIPIGSFFVSLLLHYVGLKKKISFKENYIFSFLGYATHGLIDSCTSYGTQIFWPFSNYRVAWNTVSIIDPLYTLPLLILLGISLKTQKRIWVIGGVCYAFAYMGLGLIQQKRAEKKVKELAWERGHREIEVSAKPSFGNLVVWKTVYEYDSNYYIDAIKFGLSHKFYPGESIKKFSYQRDLPWIKLDSRSAQDIERFRWFSRDYLAVHPERENVIIDVRYSMIPNRIDPLWGIVIDEKKQSEHARYKMFERNARQQGKQLWKMIID